MFSKRLIEIASLIPANSSVIDVGCDHALLDIYLTINKDCKCVGADISENCLEKAKENVKKFKLENDIALVQSDGLKSIKHGKKDIVVIAGMGTDTILDILKECKSDNIIIQSNTELYELREAITDNFIIEDEIVVLDKKIYYVIMKLKRGKKHYNYSDFLIGPIIKKNKDKNYIEYKEYLIEKYQNIYDSLSYKTLNKDTINKKLELKTMIKKIKKYC